MQGSYNDFLINGRGARRKSGPGPELGEVSEARHGHDGTAQVLVGRDRGRRGERPAVFLDDQGVVALMKRQAALQILGGHSGRCRVEGVRMEGEGGVQPLVTADLGDGIHMTLPSYPQR